MMRDSSGRWWRVPARILLGVTVSLTTTEFVEVQQLPVEALRTRFELSPSCRPALTALATDPAALHDQRVQTLRSTVYGCPEARRSAAHDQQVDLLAWREREADAERA